MTLFHDGLEGYKDQERGYPQEGKEEVGQDAEAGQPCAGREENPRSEDLWMRYVNGVEVFVQPLGLPVDTSGRG